jgi:hypothetical protein
VQVIAFATPASPDWRWRIVNYAGEMVEESYDVFLTIAGAVAAGAQRLREMDGVDVSVRANPYGSTSHLRGR